MERRGGTVREGFGSLGEVAGKHACELERRRPRHLCLKGSITSRTRKNVTLSAVVLSEEPLSRFIHPQIRHYTGRLST